MTSWGNPGIAGPDGTAAGGVSLVAGFVLSASGLQEKNIKTKKHHNIDLENKYIKTIILLDSIN